MAVNEFASFSMINMVVTFPGNAKIVAMKNKPLIFSLLSILCMVEPLIKVLYFKAITQFDFLLIIANLQARNTFVEVFDFWLVFPLAGMLILKLRKWTYFAFMSLLGYMVYNISTYERYTWPYNSDSPFVYNYVVVALSVSVFVYFLSPQVRQTFFDRRVRWWEPKSRYNVQIHCKLKGPHLTFPSQILNLSRSGAFLKDSPYLKVGARLEMEFNFLGQSIQVPLEVMNCHYLQGVSGFGVEFKFRTIGQTVRMSNVIKVLRKSQGLFEESKKAA